jgi:hypothetical protein
MHFSLTPYAHFGIKMMRVIVDLPLLNLWLPDKWDQKILLSNNEFIRKIEKSEYQLQRGHFSPFVLEIIRDSEDLGKTGNEIMGFASFFVKVLTLYKSGRVGYGNPVYVEPRIQSFDDYQKYVQLTIVNDLSTRSIGIWNPNYWLLENEIKDLIGFNNKMRSLKLEQNNQLDYSILVSLERLARTSKSIEVYEKLLDCVMSLEAVFLESEGELSYRLSHRISNVYGESENERKLVFDFVRRCYSNRNKIIHGAQFDIEDWGYMYSIEDLEEITRKCLRRAIALNELKYKGKRTKKQFLKDLDSSTFDSELRSDMQNSEKKYFEIEFPKTCLHFIEERKDEE